MRRRFGRDVVLVLALSLAACGPAKQDAPRAPAGAELPARASTVPTPRVQGGSGGSANAPAAEAPADRRTTLPGAAILGSATAVETSGRIPLGAGRETVIDPAATFEVELSTGSSDARIVLLDRRDALVAATSEREVGAARTRLTLTPAAPLTPGTRYLLRVDGAATRELHDAAGRAYEPISHTVLAAGTPPPPETKKKTSRRRRR